MEILPLQSLYTVTLFTLSLPAIVQVSDRHNSKVNSELNDFLEMTTLNYVTLTYNSHYGTLIPLFSKRIVLFLII